MKRMTITFLALAIGITQAFPVDSQGNPNGGNGGLGGLISDGGASYGSSSAQQTSPFQGGRVQSTFPLFQGFASSFPQAGGAQGASSSLQAGGLYQGGTSLPVMRPNPYASTFTQPGNQFQPAGSFAASAAPARRIGAGFVPAAPFASIPSTVQNPSTSAGNTPGPSQANTGNLNRRSHNSKVLRQYIGVPQPLVQEIVERELLSRHQQYKRKSAEVAPAVDPCASKKGFKHKLCRAKVNVEKGAKEAGGFAKHHAGEIALNVGTVAGMMALEGVTMGAATPGIVAAGGALEAAERAKNVAELGEGAVKLAKGAKVAEEGAKVLKGTEEGSKVLKGTEEAGEGIKASEEMGGTATKGPSEKARDMAKGSSDSGDETNESIEAIKSAGDSTTKGKKLPSWVTNHAGMLKEQVKQQTAQQLISGVFNHMGGTTPYKGQGANKVKAPAPPSSGWSRR